MLHRFSGKTRLALTLTYLGLWAEMLVRALWPLMAVGLLVFGVLRLANSSVWSVEGLWTGMVFVAVTIAYGLRHLRRHAYLPSRTIARARVDAQMAGQPLQALTDTQATAVDDPAVQAVWDAHLQRMQTRAAQAQAVHPNLQVSKFDPYALRYTALLIAIVGLLFGTAFSSRDVVLAGGDIAAVGPSWEGWVRPPAYTRKPSIYLNDVIGERLIVPEGSDVIIRLYGEVGALTVDETISARIEVESAADEVQNFTAQQSGTLAVRGDFGAEWAITTVEDKAPQVQLSARFEMDENNRINQRFLARDDYGVTEGRAFVTLMLDEVKRAHGLKADPIARGPVELQLPLSITGDRTQFEETLREDFSKNPWVGLPVQIVLEVEDINGQVGRSASVETELPGRSFFDPLAKAFIEQRRDILWTPENARRVAQVLRAVSLNPEDVFRQVDDVATLGGIIQKLEAIDASLTPPEQIDEIAEDIWQLAVSIEDGDLADAAAALERAQEKLAEAIRNGASAEEIQRLMDELREAQQEFMREFAERNPAEPQQRGEQTPDQDQDIVSEDQLQEMMDRLQELMEEGRMEEAAELLEEINRLMENLQMQEGQSGEGQQSEGQQALDDLGDTLRQQQDLSDEAFRDLQEGQQQGQQGQQQQGDQQGQEQGEGQQQGQGQQQGDPQDQGNQPGQSLAERQQALRDLLERQRRNMPAPGTDAGDAARQSLEDAEGAMGRAEQDLRNGDIPGAIDNQSQAMEALRQGMRDLAQALNEEQQQGQGEASERQGDGQQASPLNDIDPLGRNNGQNVNPDGLQDDMLNGEDLRQRSQDLLDEIQRRGAELDRPQDERDYLNRLLDQF
ncbi:MAG: DUF4175 domain-containing protein [Planktomarina sp.]